MWCVPESVELSEGLVHLRGRASRGRDRGADPLQLGLQGPDAGLQGGGLARAGGGGGPPAGKLLQAQTEVPDLGLQVEVAQGAGLTDGEGVAVTSAAHVAAWPADPQATHTLSCLPVAASQKGPCSGTATGCTNRRERTR